MSQPGAQRGTSFGLEEKHSFLRRENVDRQKYMEVCGLKVGGSFKSYLVTLKQLRALWFKFGRMN